MTGPRARKRSARPTVHTDECAAAQGLWLRAAAHSDGLPVRGWPSVTQRNGVIEGQGRNCRELFGQTAVLEGGDVFILLEQIDGEGVLRAIGSGAAKSIIAGTSV